MRLSHLLKSFTGKEPQMEKSSRASVTNSNAPAVPNYPPIGAQRVAREASSNPKLACDDELASNLVNQLKNTPPNQLNFKAIEKALAEPKSGAENRIWYGVCLHMQNKRAAVTLGDMGSLPTTPREVVVTAAVENILHGDSASDNFSACIKTIEGHTTANQDDLFARLLESLLIYRRDGIDEALPIVEKLYLDHKKYSPSLSVMAAYMFQRSAFAAATDFAEEALSIDDDNYQASAVISYQNIFENKQAVKNSFAHASRFLHPESPKSILFCRYAMLDPE